MTEPPQIFIGNQTAFSAATPREPFDYAVANGFDAFEFFPDKKPDGTGWDETAFDANARAEIRQTAIAHGIRLSVHARGSAQLFSRLHTQEAFPTAHVGMCLDIGHANLCASTRGAYLP